MSDIAIVDSSKRKIDIETFRNELKDFSTDRIALTSGDIGTTIDEDIDLTSYRAIYVRVGEITADVLDRAPNLEIVATCGSGYDHVDLEAATERGVIVTHTPEAPAPGVVEHTFGLIFSLVHRFPEMFELTKRGDWGEGQTIVGELRGRTIGVVGLGTVGSKIATIASDVYDAEVIAYDPYVTGELTSDIYPRVSAEEMTNHGIGLVDKEALFQDADIVTMHVPLTERTHHMVSTSEFGELENDYFINTSRGEVVDEQALIAAVKEKKLAGVGLDVMQSEPPNSSNPLLSAPNVYVTPHIAGGTEGYPERSAKINAQRIACVLRGETPDKVVNPDVLDVESET